MHKRFSYKSYLYKRLNKLFTQTRPKYLILLSRAYLACKSFISPDCATRALLYVEIDLLNVISNTFILLITTQIVGFGKLILQVSTQWNQRIKNSSSMTCRLASRYSTNIYIILFLIRSWHWWGRYSLIEYLQRLIYIDEVFCFKTMTYFVPSLILS